MAGSRGYDQFITNTSINIGDSRSRSIGPLVRSPSGDTASARHRRARGRRTPLARRPRIPPPPGLGRREASEAGLARGWLCVRVVRVDCITGGFPTGANSAGGTGGRGGGGREKATYQFFNDVCVCVCLLKCTFRPCHPSHSMPLALIVPREEHVCVCVCVGMRVPFTSTDRASTIPSPMRGCQSGMYVVTNRY